MKRTITLIKLYFIAILISIKFKAKTKISIEQGLLRIYFDNYTITYSSKGLHITNIEYNTVHSNYKNSSLKELFWFINNIQKHYIVFLRELQIPYIGKEVEKFKERVNSLKRFSNRKNVVDKKIIEAAHTVAESYFDIIRKIKKDLDILEIREEEDKFNFEKEIFNMVTTLYPNVKYFVIN